MPGIPFVKSLNFTDFVSAPATATDVSLQASKWVTICSYTVPAQQRIAIGVTESVAGGGQGQCAYMRFDDTAGAQMSVELFRVVIADANEQQYVSIREDTGARWAASATDRTLCQLMPESKVQAGEDSKIMIQIKTTKTGATFDMSDADNSITLPVTIYPGR